MSQWSAKELAGMDETGWRIWQAMRTDDLERSVRDAVDNIRIDQQQIAGIERRCASRRWHGKAIAGLVALLVSSAVGALGWLCSKVLP